MIPRRNRTAGSYQSFPPPFGDSEGQIFCALQVIGG
jgi:hypothetical protein